MVGEATRQAVGKPRRGSDVARSKDAAIKRGCRFLAATVGKREREQIIDLHGWHETA